MSWLSDGAMDHLRRLGPEVTTFALRYELLEEIGRGGMGTIYRAFDRILHREVAMKILCEKVSGADFSARLVREAQVLARLEHPGIVPIHDLGRLPDGRIWYAMKLVEGRTLDQRGEYVNDLSSCLRLFVRICESVAFAHDRGVIHRDLKPANIMVGKFGEVLVMDWGLAKSLTCGEQPLSEGEEETVVPHGSDGRAAAESVELATAVAGNACTKPGTVMGTPGFMPPEQAEGRMEAVDARSDVFALGKTLDRMIDPVREPLPRRLRSILAKATAAEPSKRYESAGALRDDLLRFMDDQPVEAHPEGVFEKIGRFIYRYQTPISLVLAYLVIRALVIFL